MLYTERFGEGRLLVSLHGWGMNASLEKADFEPVFAERTGWERLYLDLPGMGRSPAQDRVRNLEDMLAAVLNTLDTQVGSRPFALAGTSAGAYLARGIVARRKEQLMGLMLRVPRVHPDWIKRDLPAFSPIVEDSRFMVGLTDNERAALEPLLVQTPIYASAFLEKKRTLLDPAEQIAQTDFLERIRQSPERYSFRERPEQQPFHNPTLIVTGRQDTVTGYRDALSLLEHYPRATFAILDRATHEWPLPEPQQQRLFAGLVNDWLTRMEEVSRTSPPHGEA